MVVVLLDIYDRVVVLLDKKELIADPMVLVVVVGTILIGQVIFETIRSASDDSGVVNSIAVRGYGSLRSEETSS